MAKAEISWKRRTEDGERVAVYAQHVGSQWKFFMRNGRYDQWQAVAEPPLEDWMELLDAVQRRINRRLARPEEEARVKKMIHEKFPEAKSLTPEKAPLILISPNTEVKGDEFGDMSISLSETYQRAIMVAGGLPLVLPGIASPEMVAECVAHCDGVLFTGGDDINPKLYAKQLPAKLAKTVNIEKGERDLRELILVDEIFKQKKPLMGICRGHQIINVALGGTLVVDIPTQVPGAINHRRMDKKSQVVHEARLTGDSMLAKITGKQSLGVNSTHHQAIGRVAKPLKVTAASDDGVVEATELSRESAHLLPYFMTVQFHPERLAPRYPEHQEVFNSFTRACVANRNRKL